MDRFSQTDEKSMHVDEQRLHIFEISNCHPSQAESDFEKRIELNK